MPTIVLRDVQGKEIASLSVTEHQLSDVHSATIDRDRHRLYFKLAYQFHAEIKDSGDPSKSEVRRKERQTAKPSGK